MIRWRFRGSCLLFWLRPAGIIYLRITFRANLKVFVKRAYPTSVDKCFSKQQLCMSFSDFHVNVSRKVDRLVSVRMSATIVGVHELRHLALLWNAPLRCFPPKLVSWIDVSSCGISCFIQLFFFYFSFSFFFFFFYKSCLVSSSDCNYLWSLHHGGFNFWKRVTKIPCEKNPPQKADRPRLSPLFTFNPIYKEYCSTTFVHLQLPVLIAGGIIPALLWFSQWRG